MKTIIIRLFHRFQFSQQRCFCGNRRRVDAYKRWYFHWLHWKLIYISISILPWNPRQPNPKFCVCVFFLGEKCQKVITPYCVICIITIIFPQYAFNPGLMLPKTGEKSTRIYLYFILSLHFVWLCFNNNIAIICYVTFRKVDLLFYYTLALYIYVYVCALATPPPTSHPSQRNAKTFRLWNVIRIHIFFYSLLNVGFYFLILCLINIFIILIWS